MSDDDKAFKLKDSLQDAPIEAETDADSDIEDTRAPLSEHLTELRSRLIKISLALAIVAIAAFFITKPALEYLFIPFKNAALGSGRDLSEIQLIYTSAFEVLFVRLQLSLIIAFALTFPYLAWQAYAFIAPGLYKSERQSIIPFLCVAPLLFSMGAALVYFMIMPFVMQFALSQELGGVAIDATFLPKVNEYMKLMLSLIFAFGMAFQLPLIVTLLAMAGIASSKGLRSGRKYAVVGIFAVSMLMTPADPFSQTALALPVCILYEIGILAAAIIERRRQKREAEEEF